MTTLEAVILGIVEGLTEFLPISSTGHLILVSNLLGIQQTEQHKAFEVSIQLGSILAVVFLYFKKFLDTNLMKRILIAFIPTGILGFVLYKIIKSLFNPYIVVFMLVFGGLLLILIELYHKNKSYDINSIYEVPYQKAFLIGVFQSLAMVPGTSRSGATIVGGLLLGLDRKTAAEFSFMLAVPTMFMATFYDVYKNRSNFNLSDWENLIVGFVVAFISALFAIKWLLKFISNHSFIPFGIYRIILGILYYLWY
ncbi:MAG TPA: undecaprenyl-diphosphate phosphatase [Sulfurihydrogenibium sp.]|uniref:Undecaprenyl-diphosphatase n=1 Tax=Sulfurihydrogenibium sp. (strain YO3AOP1) TaxID=436114 RepID=UPPP_SULSY|nr:undecaprenyl-diphosphate phosphatase [Sulfurihydrogenibium sp. YO3AOP1]B2V5I7.1 RecName: Full=Undecaprenyl-diphosphatase; AltName: Full=Bacitracin resistance protein; AltName: Full=Undecaprenyl pyrophosphate phosphatase [Sulfurihydrogenibium sp. YO3AOP1]ACD66931.1 undecaprenol kinase [Sulfurihydrogenibium sp. YO3AOP1]HBT97987.1 undecaprenyl-diphosphate phosphatase [Sulfurihydrogenibium sp.]